MDEQIDPTLPRESDPVEAAWLSLLDFEHMDERCRDAVARHRPAIEAAILAGHDCFFDGQPPRPARPAQDIESLRMDLTDEEAEQFLAAIRSRPVEVDRPGITTLGEQNAWQAGFDAGRADALAPSMELAARPVEDPFPSSNLHDPNYDPRLHAGHEAYMSRGLCSHPSHAPARPVEEDPLSCDGYPGNPDDG